ncbi:TetR/AcrR family transcriptional regulator [Streptomyces sp. CBMA123]|uniref:TetR/AcrR family transcriptional regulator n=1 Tax=Streptomyces sp. CBMA123 TaxID=1896313 RepID=UPI001661DA5A|nr:TetR/AcrR family transcriptional regulator [Streptomyces sp. CBMA123]MBD0693282.1 TetR family transcriptional regulator [Streptomyces sp. CBMA123]
MGNESSAPPSRPRNRRGEGARLRDDIVAAAVELLDETGTETAVTLRSVARRVGIAAPSIYRHFPDQPAIMLAVVRQAFDELEAELRAAQDAAGEDPRQRLLALCHAYLGFSENHPERYRTMFGGVWVPALQDTAVTAEEMSSLGQASLQLLAEALTGCVAAGLATSDDPFADTVALWLGLHGLAHQRAVTVAFSWPPDIAERLITTLAHLKAE